MHIVMQLSCKKCGYTWQYAGNKHRTSCSKCRTSITLSGIDKTIQEVEKVLNTKRQYRLTRKTIDSHAWTKAYGWSNSNKEDIIFKANDEGILSL